MKINLNNASSSYKGLGDLVLLAWLAEGSKLTTDPIELYTTDETRRQNWAAFLGQRLAENGVGAVDPGPAYRRELDDRQRSARWVYVANQLGRSDLIPTRPPVLVSRAAPVPREPHVLLMPRASHPIRNWHPAYWTELAKILQDEGLRTPVLLAPDQDTAPYEHVGDIQNNLPLPVLAAWVSSAKLVIGVDSFGVHLAGTLDVPTIALTGPTRSTVFQHLIDANSAPFVTLTSEYHCTGCAFAHPPCQPYCSLGCRSLLTLAPEEVARVALTLIR